MKVKDLKNNELLRELALDMYISANHYTMLLANMEHKIHLSKFLNPDLIEKLSRARKSAHNVLIDNVNILCRNYLKILKTPCPLLEELNIESRESIASWAINESWKSALKQLIKS